MNPNPIAAPLKLPCGSLLKNRIAKAAMSENMSTPDHAADGRMEALYSRWAEGGAGLLITGNIMIDPSALGEPRNIVIDKGRDHSALKRWAEAGTRNETQLWAQLNHPGKQSPQFLSRQPVAPSAIELKPPLNKLFRQPRALEEQEIHDLIGRFGYAARVAQECGFTGVQIHGAHGYLVSQFLSPHHNQRTDSWGGSLENRMRFAVEVYQAIRREVGPGYPVSIKLNSADFQRGGFTQEDSMQVVRHLSAQGMDLIEISGGNYESPEMMGMTQKTSTREREAYFLDYCEKVRGNASAPLMLTGGFRSWDGMNAALNSGACDVIGLARAIALNPLFPRQLLSGRESREIKSEVRPLTTGWRVLDRLFPLEITWYTQQLHRMGKGKSPKPNLSVKASVLSTMIDLGTQSLRRVRG